jgi:hypothetical protein
MIFRPLVPGAWLEEETMILPVLRQLVPQLVMATLLLPGLSIAAPQPAATLMLQHRPSDGKWISDGNALFGAYLGSGGGVATDALAGAITWDLYEDQSRDHTHPTLFRGFIERDGKRHAFEIIGVFTPDGLATPRRWFLSGTIVLEDDKLLGVRAAPVTGSGSAETGVWKHSFTIWVDRDENPRK